MAKKSAAATFVMGGCREAASKTCTTATARAATPNCMKTMVSLLRPCTCRKGVSKNKQSQLRQCAQDYVLCLWLAYIL